MGNPFGTFRPARYAYNMQALATALVKMQDLHEGIWMVAFRFQQHAANIDYQGHAAPAVMNILIEAQLVRCEKVTDLSVDAAVVNPESRILTPAGGMH